MDTLIDFEISLIKAFQWSLFDIDSTSIDSMFGFVARLSGKSRGTRTYCDDVSWL